MPRELIRVLKPWSAETGCIWLFPGTRRKGPWIDGAPGSRALDQVKALGERAGVKGLTILSFRHTIGTLAEPAGLDQLELQRQLRHTNTKTQHGYRHLDEDNVRRIADKLARGYKSAIAGVPRELLSPRVG
jgi:integrase